MLGKIFKTLLVPSIRTTINPTFKFTSTKRTERSLAKTFICAGLGKEADLVPGCIVVCDLAGSFADHTGIYIGQNNRIVERNGDGKIKKVTPHAFMNSHGLRTGITLYAAYSNGKIISSPEISDRASAAVGNKSGYNLIFNNCHRFTAYCATGVEHSVTTFDSLTTILEEIFPNLRWVPVKDQYTKK
ncbi:MULTISPECIES: lecithin retinol acyltransferase family protein [Pseudomonas]|uniref:Lecithin retinol acyltransferase family protein n=1 Tax=Pseudomonas auratipiscis TaxID=3115853 RepID=A0AB35WVX3_9PSED|nr:MULTISPECIES: lecithin retinol acyltransferase family protein [unclassified Pseudomonas]MEE1866239.1 lecithin retinol acyltransferase family protein [Pseudomonas sp. 120P]MEE1957625.1 lecithin retinol acyltransferase family protein [Pseudomonas sp. 119P]